MIQKRYDKAINHLKPIVEKENIPKNILGPTLDSLGSSYFNLNDLKNAEVYFKKAGQIKEINNDLSRHISYYNLGLVQYETKQYEKAKTSLNKCIALRKNIYDTNHPRIQGAKSLLADINKMLN